MINQTRCAYLQHVISASIRFTTALLAFVIGFRLHKMRQHNALVCICVYIGSQPVYNVTKTPLEVFGGVTRLESYNIDKNTQNSGTMCRVVGTNRNNLGEKQVLYIETVVLAVTEEIYAR